MKKFAKSFGALTLALVLMLSTTACGSSADYETGGVATPMAPSFNAAVDSLAGSYFESSKSESVREDVYYPEEAPAQGSGNTDSDTASYLESQKLIYSCSMDIESKEFEKAQADIKSLVKQYDGFVAYDSVTDNAHNWYYSSYDKTHGTLRENMTVRVPTKNYNNFVNGLSAVGKVLAKNENVENITKQYADVETTVKSLRTQENRLLEMMAACDTVSEMITVETRLSEVQRQLERYQTQLDGMDMDIQFSTVTITLTEVVEFTNHVDEIGFLQEFREAILDSSENFVEFVQDVLIMLVYCLPYLAIIAFIVVAIIQLTKKKHNKKVAAVAQSVKVEEPNKVESVKTEQNKDNKSKK